MKLIGAFMFAGGLAMLEPSGLPFWKVISINVLLLMGADMFITGWKR